MGTGREFQEETRVISKAIVLKTAALDCIGILGLSLFSKRRVISGLPMCAWHTFHSCPYLHIAKGCLLRTYWVSYEMSIYFVVLSLELAHFKGFSEILQDGLVLRNLASRKCLTKFPSFYCIYTQVVVLKNLARTLCYQYILVIPDLVVGLLLLLFLQKF